MIVILICPDGHQWIEGSKKQGGRCGRDLSPPDSLFGKKPCRKILQLKPKKEKKDEINRGSH